MKIIFNKPKKNNSSFFMDIKNKANIVKEKIKSNEQKPNIKQYVLLVLMLIVGLLSISLSMQKNKETSKEKYDTYKLEDVNKGNIEDTKYQTAISSISTNVSNVEEKKKVEGKYTLPTDGIIIKRYSTEELILSETLDMWMTHDGIDVSGNIGDSVYAVEDGTVEDIYLDALYGTSIIINHKDGITSVYSNLQEEVKAKKGENVKKGTVIGKIGKTAIIEVNDEPHIHLEILKDGNNIDPSQIGLK